MVEWRAPMDLRAFLLRRATPVAILLVAVFILLTLSFRPETDATLWWALFDAAHLPLFVLVGWVLVWAVPRRGFREIGWVVISVGVVAAGTEVAQHYVERDASVGDFLWNLAGGALGVALGRAWLGRGAGDRSAPASGAPRSPLAILFLGALSVLLFALAATPAVRELRVLRHFRDTYPRFGDFETALDIMLWRGLVGSRIQRTTEWSAHGGSALSIVPGRGRVTGIGIDGRAFEWTAYDSLSFAVKNASVSFPLSVRIDDDLSRGTPRGGWTGRFEIPPGETPVSIPLDAVRSGGADGRALRMARIRRVQIYAESVRAPRGFLIDDVRVIPAPSRAAAQHP